jgi:hypothetical protein
MKKLYTVVFFLVSLLSFNCQKEVHHIGGPEFPTVNAPNPVTATLQGNVVDENDAPAAGVTIKAGAKTTQTDAKGFFRIINAPLDLTAAVVTAEKDGYFKAYRTFQASKAANHIRLKLTKRQLAGTIAAGGGEVTLSSGAKIALPASAVVKAAGGSYSGDVKVYAAFIDPASSDISATVPGSFMADNAAGERVTLASFGMLAVELESGAAEKLQIAAGKEAVLTMPIPASLRSAAPSSISLWYVDEKTGIWKEEGKATRSGDNYTGAVKHFSFWNCDIGLPGVQVSLTLKNEKGIPLVHAGIRLTGSVNGAPTTGYGFTDSLGHVSGFVLSGQALKLEVWSDQCQTPLYTANVGPFSTDTDLGTITIGSGNRNLVTILGKIVNCNGAPVTNGSALINVANTSRYISTNSNGEFSSVYIKCDNDPQTVSVLGIDNAGLQQGNFSAFTVSTGTELNTGTLIACGISAAEYISYQVEGTAYSVSGQNPGDSITMNSYLTQQPTPIFVNSISGYSQNWSKNIYLSFNSSLQDAGTYAMKALSVNQYPGAQPTASSSVTVTKFPQIPGEFMEGTFSGQFRDSISQNPLRTISGSFRIRKQW